MTTAPCRLLLPAALLLALAGCAPADSPAATVPGDAAAAPGGAAPTITVADSCDTIAGAVAPYIEGLVAEESNAEPFNEWGGACNWREPDTATDLSEIRSVEVVVSLQTGETAESLAELAESGYFELVDAPGAARVGGIAHAISIDAVAQVVVTSVMIPDVTVVVSGGRWESVPSLDAEAAVPVAERLLGL
ncbi:hypothetical protein [Salinibacterium sp. ZJ70]|uniref:hypothetical protein n=1 Tax=Salinibacterium sp. ZJ70 TaxID=2708084 RepID=UPI00141EE2F6|nr:hypothetical protein [Salinibacterium sp. ZJ70]